MANIDYDRPKILNVLEFFKMLGWQLKSTKIGDFIEQIASSKKTNFFQMNYPKMKENNDKILSDENDQFIGKIRISKNDLISIESNNWLNDKIIDSYFKN
jgi:Ulp1 family protease